MRWKDTQKYRVIFSKDDEPIRLITDRCGSRIFQTKRNHVWRENTREQKSPPSKLLSLFSAKERHRIKSFVKDCSHGMIVTVVFYRNEWDSIWDSAHGAIATMTLNPYSHKLQ